MRSSEPVRPASEQPGARQVRDVASWIGVFIFLLLAPLALTGYFYSIGWTIAGRYCAAFAVVSITILWVGYYQRLHRPTSTESIAIRPVGASGALMIPYSTRIYFGYGALMASLAAVFVMATADSLVGSARGSNAGTYIWAALALVSLSLPVLMATGRFGKGRIELSAEGVYQRGWTFESYLPWSNILGVAAEYDADPAVLLPGADETLWRHHQITRLWRQDRLPPVASIVIPKQFISIDIDLTYRLLKFYFDNPNARAELNTETALWRARSGTFE